VITVQELSGMGLHHLEEGLGSTWTCYAEAFGGSLIATCVKGKATGVRSQRLSGERYNQFTDWWGYVQVTYHGVQTTNVHTRAHWADEHVEQLHREVKTGIVAGDFNHDDPGWHQTASVLEPTWTNRKIDHVLTVEKPQQASSIAQEKGGSNHRVILATVKFGPQQATKPSTTARPRRRIR
jgi:hypothetical protein